MSDAMAMAHKKTSASSKLRLKYKVPVQAYLEKEQAAALKALSARTRVPQQVYLREGIDHVLEKYRPAPESKKAREEL